MRIIGINLYVESIFHLLLANPLCRFSLSLHSSSSWLEYYTDFVFLLQLLSTLCFIVLVSITSLSFESTSLHSQFCTESVGICKYSSELAFGSLAEVMMLHNYSPSLLSFLARRTKSPQLFFSRVYRWRPGLPLPTLGSSSAYWFNSPFTFVELCHLKPLRPFGPFPLATRCNYYRSSYIFLCSWCLTTRFSLWSSFHYFAAYTGF